MNMVSSSLYNRLLQQSNLDYSKSLHTFWDLDLRDTQEIIDRTWLLK